MLSTKQYVRNVCESLVSIFTVGWPGPNPMRQTSSASPHSMKSAVHAGFAQSNLLYWELCGALLKLHGIGESPKTIEQLGLLNFLNSVQRQPFDKKQS